MDNGTLYYAIGGLLAASAVTVSFLGLRLGQRFPGRAAPLIALWFIVLIAFTTTFAVLHGQDEEQARAAAVAAEAR